MIVREVRLAAGAGFVVALCGDIMTMPGLPRVPAADTIGDDGGRVACSRSARWPIGKSITGGRRFGHPGAGRSETRLPKGARSIRRRRTKSRRCSATRAPHAIC